MKLADESPFEYAHSNPEPANAGRELFFRLLHFNEFAGSQRLARVFLNDRLTTVKQIYQPRFSKLTADSVDRLQAEFPSSVLLTGADQFTESLRQAAPVILTEPCWLQDICQAANNQNPLSVALFRIYQTLNKARLDNAYRFLIASVGLAQPTLYLHSYCLKSDLLTGFFDFATIQLALSYSPELYLAEILGFTLAYCRSETVPEHCFPQQAQHHDFFHERRRLLISIAATLEQLIREYLQTRPERKEHNWQRVQSGFWLYQELFNRCVKQLIDYARQEQSVAQAMLALLQRKAAAAIGHHGKIQLAGQCLDDWFRQLPENGAVFLSALRDSPYVDCDRPANSSLLKLFDVNGPMFGILSVNELAVVSQWLCEDGDRAPAIVAVPKQTDSHDVLPDETPVEKTECKHLSNRQLFYFLVNADHYPEVFAYTETRVSRQMKVFQLFSQLPFKRYSHGAFERFLQTVYQGEMAAYQPLIGKPRVSRQAYLWGLEQFAPTVLIDGAWLQHCHWLQYAYPEIAKILTGIYADELGNGNLEQSHPVVFRQLMEQLHIHLPPVNSKSFAERSNFVDSAFDLPVFMLSLAKFPLRFLPELLGLNMAIELSGLGKVYLRMIDELDYWRIDSTIARLHVTIDNFADGHSAQAKTAIQSYLDEVLAGQGEEVMQQHWRRIFTGYCSLKMVCWRFKLAVPSVYMRHKICLQFS